MNTPHWASETFFSAFETGLIVAAPTEFLNAIHWGSYFHFTQAFFRKNQTWASKSFTTKVKVWFFSWKIMYVGFPPLWEFRNAILDLLDEEPIWTFFPIPRNIRFFSLIFKIHGKWFLPQNCGTFSIDLPECEQQIFAKGATVAGTVEPVVRGPIFGWRSNF